jgi:cell division protein FtsB
MTHFSKEQLINDTSLPKLIDQAYENFSLFFIIFFLYMMLVVMYTIIQYKAIKEDKKDQSDKNQTLDLQNEKKTDETNLEKKI